MRVTKDMRMLGQRPFWKRTLGFNQETDTDGPVIYGTAPSPWTGLSLFHYKITASGLQGASHFAKWSTFIPVHIHMMLRDGSIQSILNQGGDSHTTIDQSRIIQTQVQGTENIRTKNHLLSFKKDERHYSASPFMSQRFSDLRRYMKSTVSQLHASYLTQRATPDSVQRFSEQERTPGTEDNREKQVRLMTRLDQLVSEPTFYERIWQMYGDSVHLTQEESPVWQTVMTKPQVTMTHTIPAGRMEEDSLPLQPLKRKVDTLSRIFYSSFNRIQYLAINETKQDRRMLQSLYQVNHSWLMKQRSSEPLQKNMNQVPAPDSRSKGFRTEGQSASVSSVSKREREAYSQSVLKLLEKPSFINLMPLRESLLMNLTKITPKGWSPLHISYFKQMEKQNRIPAKSPGSEMASGNDLRQMNFSETKQQIHHTAQTTNNERLSRTVSLISRTRQMMEQMMTKDVTTHHLVQQMMHQEYQQFRSKDILRETTKESMNPVQRTDELSTIQKPLLNRGLPETELDRKLLVNKSITEKLFIQNLLMASNPSAMREAGKALIARLEERRSHLTPYAIAKNELSESDSVERRFEPQSSGMLHRTREIRESKDTAIQWKSTLERYRDRLNTIIREQQYDVKQTDISKPKLKPDDLSKQHQTAVEQAVNRMRPASPVLNRMITMQTATARVRMQSMLHHIHKQSFSTRQSSVTTSDRNFKQTFGKWEEWQKTVEELKRNIVEESSSLSKQRVVKDRLKINRLPTDKTLEQIESGQEKRLLAIWLKQRILHHRIHEPKRDDSPERNKKITQVIRRLEQQVLHVMPDKSVPHWFKETEKLPEAQFTQVKNIIERSQFSLSSPAKVFQLIESGTSINLTKLRLNRASNTAKAQYDSLISRYERLQQTLQQKGTQGPAGHSGRSTVFRTSVQDREHESRTFKTDRTLDFERVQTRTSEKLTETRSTVKELRSEVNRQRETEKKERIFRQGVSGVQLQTLIHSRTHSVKPDMRISHFNSLTQALMAKLPDQSSKRTQQRGMKEPGAVDIRFLKQPAAGQSSERPGSIQSTLSPRMEFRKSITEREPEAPSKKEQVNEVKVQTQVFESDYLKTQRERVQLETIVEKVFQEIERRNHFQRQRSGWS